MKVPFLSSKTFWQGIFWGWAILIVFLTSMPKNPEIIHQKKDALIRFDYLEHIFFFGILSVLHYMAYLTTSGHTTKIKIYLWLIAGLLFASLTEIYQILIPGRGYNPVDLGLNISGLIIGIPFGKWFSSRNTWYRS
jgi:VanZ family protein